MPTSNTTDLAKPFHEKVTACVCERACLPGEAHCQREVKEQSRTLIGKAGKSEMWEKSSENTC